MPKNVEQFVMLFDASKCTCSACITQISVMPFEETYIIYKKRTKSRKRGKRNQKEPEKIERSEQ